jgi:hypothetical protein
MSKKNGRKRSRHRGIMMQTASAHRGTHTTAGKCAALLSQYGHNTRGTKLRRRGDMACMYIFLLNYIGIKTCIKTWVITFAESRVLLPQNIPPPNPHLLAVSRSLSNPRTWAAWLVRPRRRCIVLLNPRRTVFRKNWVRLSSKTRRKKLSGPL